MCILDQSAVVLSGSVKRRMSMAWDGAPPPSAAPDPSKPGTTSRRRKLPAWMMPGGCPAPRQEQPHDNRSVLEKPASQPSQPASQPAGQPVSSQPELAPACALPALMGSKRTWALNIQDTANLRHRIANDDDAESRRKKRTVASGTAASGTFLEQLVREQLEQLVQEQLEQLVQEQLEQAAAEAAAELEACDMHPTLPHLEQPFILRLYYPSLFPSLSFTD